MNNAAPRLDVSAQRVPRRAVLPSRSDAVVAAASHVIGGPVGRHVVPGVRGWRPAAAVLSALSAVFVALGVLQKNHCVSHGWATPGSLWRACYSDLPVAVAGDAGSDPWANSANASSPPLTALITWLVRIVVPGGSQLRLQQGMFAWGAAVIALLIAAAVCFTAATMRRGPWVAAHVALSPVLITTALISFDALGVALVAAGLWAWSRHRSVLAGALLAAALLARPALATVLVAVVLVAVARRRWPELERFLLGAALTIALAVGVMLLAGANPIASFTAWKAQGATYGSLWQLLAFAGIDLSSGTLTALAALGWLLAVALGWLLARDATMTPAPVALLMLVVVMLTSRSLPVQAALWVLPLIALCAIRWRDHLAWAGAEFIYFVVVWGFIARSTNMGKALPEEWFALFVGVRLVALLFLARAGIEAAGGERHARRPAAAMATPQGPSTDFVRHDANG